MNVLEVNNKLSNILLVLALTFGCRTNDPVLEPSDLTLNLQSTHYNYYYNDNDIFIADTLWMESHFKWVTDQLGIEPTYKLNYYKYIDRSHLERITGKRTNGFAEIGNLNFHSIWHPESHENVHTLVINEIGHPPALFNEGIAVSLAPQPIYGKGVFVATPTWNGKSIDKISLTLKNNGNLFTLDTLLESISFFKLETSSTYPIAGSFVKYLLTTYSLTQLKNFFSSISFDSSSDKIKTQFMNAYNKNIEEVWDEWINQL